MSFFNSLKGHYELHQNNYHIQFCYDPTMQITRMYIDTQHPAERRFSNKT
jgi:hypothetical protein